jgi:S-adenosylmethionine-diacylglycerol 3-amino-3-carboxypropyl transferase
MISYSQCWEDAEVTTKALTPKENDTILSVTSGGCNALALASSNARMIFSIDSNPEQNFLLELKFAAIKHLNLDDAIRLLGYRSCSKRMELFQTIEPTISTEAQLYWEKNREDIKHGVVHSGKFERYLWTFRNFVLPLVHNKKRVNTLLNPTDEKQQCKFYDTQWNTRRWRMLFNLFFSRKVMSGNGRSKEMFSHSHSVPTAKLFFMRAENGLKFGRVTNNFYLSYVLHGKKSKLMPYYLNQDLVISLKTKNNLNIQNTDILTFLSQMPDQSIDKFNLSDIFEPLSIEKSNAIFAEIARTAKPGARLIFWNNLVSRNIPSNLQGVFERDIDAENDLRKIDRVFFYDRFYVYRVVG